jgi:ABC-2 type transport system permease protein
MNRKPVPQPSQISVCLGLTRYALKASFRNKAGYVFSFIFPLVFVLVFGMLGSGRQSVKLAIANDLSHDNPVYVALTRVASQPGAVVELVAGPEADLRGQLARGRVAAILAPVPGDPGNVTLVTSNGNPQGKAAAAVLLHGVLSEMNLRAAGITEPTFKLRTQEISGKQFRYIDFILPGQIGFSMLSLATFGIAFTFTTLRKTLVLKRMMATTVRPLTFVISQGLTRSFQAMIQTTLIIVIGIVLFRFTLAHGWATFGQMLVLSFIGILVFLAFGILISNAARDEQTLPVVLNLFNLPQMLLAGVFFPIDGMPGWVQLIGNNLPLAYLNTSLRKVALEGASLPDVWPYLAGMSVWAIAAYVFAARTFRTE